MRSKIISILAAFIVIFVAASFIYGIRIFYVTSGSMEPQIKTGSACIVDTRASDADIAPGTVIAFDMGGLPVCHRVIKVTEGYITKGDANNCEDPGIVTKDQVIGKVIGSIPYLGYGIHFIRDKWRLIAAAIVIIGIVLWLYRTNKITTKKNGCS